MRRKMLLIIAFIFSLVVPIIGYFYVGALIAGLFLIGYLGGYFMWLFFGRDTAWAQLRTPYWLAFAIYILLHKVEENRMKFFEVVGEKITGIPVPEMTPFLILGLLVIPLGSWLLIPILVKRGYAFGQYLIWTYFASFGLVELAHFVFPLLTKEPYGYFPGMASATILVPVGFWGMWKLCRGGNNKIYKQRPEIK